MNKICFKVALLIAIFGAHAYSMEDVSNQLAHNEALFQAIKMNNYNGVKQALDAGADVNALSFKEMSRTALGSAIFYKFHQENYNSEIIELLLSRGAHPDLYKIEIKSGKHESTIRRAIAPDHLGVSLAWAYPVISLLLQHGANPQKNDFQLWAYGDRQTNHDFPLEKLIYQFITYDLKEKNEWTADRLKIGLLTLNLLDKKESGLGTITEQLEAQIAEGKYGENCLWTGDSVQEKIDMFIKMEENYLQELDKEIKKDLEQKEDKYLTSCMQKCTKSRLKAFMGAQITGRLSLLSHEHNKIHYNGRTYLVSKKH